LFHQKAV